MPWWSETTAPSAGKEIARLKKRYRWFRHIDFNEITLGPYRLIPEAEFLPSRDAANVFLASMPDRARARPGRRRLTETELQAYDLLVQHGAFERPVVDLILQRLGDPDRLRGEERVAAFRILATYYKSRGDLPKARELAEKGLRFARRRRSRDDVAYLLDQLGGISQHERHSDEARTYYQQEIDYLRQGGTHLAEFHLVGAYRGLAGALRALGDTDEARKAIRLSRRLAERSGNEEGRRLAILEEARLSGKDATSPTPMELVTAIPTEHMSARVIGLCAAAEVLLRRGERAEGERLLRLAFQEARRLGLTHDATNAVELGRRFALALGNRQGQ